MMAPASEPTSFTYSVLLRRPLFSDLIEIVAHEVRDRSDDVGGGTHGRLLAREDVVERDWLVLVEPGGATDLKRRRSKLPLVRSGGIENRRVRHQRREELIVHDAE